MSIAVTYSSNDKIDKQATMQALSENSVVAMSYLEMTQLSHGGDSICLTDVSFVKNPESTCMVDSWLAIPNQVFEEHGFQPTLH